MSNAWLATIRLRRRFSVSSSFKRARSEALIPPNFWRHRPTVTENLGPAYGYHVWDLGLAQDNLVSDVAAAEITWTRGHR